jgi:hypothetical protein
MTTQPLAWIEIRALLVLVAMLLVPGWAFVSITGLWARWKTLQRWCAAVAISIAFYPVLYYWARMLLPDLDLGVKKLTVLLLVLGGLALWGLRKNFKAQFSFERSEWIAIGVFLAALFTRVWFAHLHPYPAWSDSLHHTLLTQLTAQSGGLPTTLDPYEPVPLGMYHLGLYALSGALQLLSQVPAHTALLWTAQVLNGLCTLGVFFVLDRKVGRRAALVGSVVVGLLSFQPAWYVNWGRFTQVASQSILLIAWLLTWEALSAWAQPGKRKWSEITALTLASALLTASIFLLHFRVAGFYLPLVLVSVIWEGIHALQRKRGAGALAGILTVGATSLLFTMPVLFEAVGAYLSRSSQQAASVPLTQNPSFTGTNLSSIPLIGLRPWLIYTVFACLLLLLLRRKMFGAAMLFWLVSLFLMGYAYRLNIPVLAFTNFGAVIIMLYLPAALIVGAAAEELLLVLPVLQKSLFQVAMAIALLLAGLAGGCQRLSEIEPFRYFVTDGDLQAMAWIQQNTPPGAVFAINTLFEVADYPHGTDGGFWIPYFTGRKTTTGSMLFSLGSNEYREWVISQSHLVQEVQNGIADSSRLCNAGADYIYITDQPVQIFPALPYNLSGNVIYEATGVKILACP